MGQNERNMFYYDVYLLVSARKMEFNLKPPACSGRVRCKYELKSYLFVGIVEVLFSSLLSMYVSKFPK